VKKRWKLGLLFVVGLVVTSIGFVALRPSEPVYQGKRISAWIADLGSNDRELIEPAHQVLVELGEPAIPHLISTVEKKQSRFHSWYLNFWSFRKLPEFVRRRLPAPISHVYLARVNSVMVLSRMGPKASLAGPALVRSLGDTGLGMRMAAAQALGMIGPEARPAIPALVKMLKEYEPHLRQIATQSLMQIGDPTGKAIEPLTVMLNDTTNEARVSAAIALWLLEGQSEPTLDLLKKDANPEDWRTRFFTAHSLGDFGSAAKPAVPALRELLHDEHEAVREHAAEALKKIGAAAAQKAEVK
jgi:HEAT repeat protein